MMYFAYEKDLQKIPNKSADGYTVYSTVPLLVILVQHIS